MTPGPPIMPHTQSALTLGSLFSHGPSFSLATGPEPSPSSLRVTPQATPSSATPKSQMCYVNPVLLTAPSARGRSEAGFKTKDMGPVGEMGLHYTGVRGSRVGEPCPANCQPLEACFTALQACLSVPSNTSPAPPQGPRFHGSQPTRIRTISLVTP